MGDLLGSGASQIPCILTFPFCTGHCREIEGERDLYIFTFIVGETLYFGIIVF